jgi:hypothetical protein
MESPLMKPATMLWAKFESKGKPDATQKHNCSMRDAILRLGEWMLSVNMGSYIRVTLARTEQELEAMSQANQRTPISADTDMLAELQEMMAQDTLGFEERESV